MIRKMVMRQSWERTKRLSNIWSHTNSQLDMYVHIVSYKIEVGPQNGDANTKSGVF